MNGREKEKRKNSKNIKSSYVCIFIIIGGEDGTSITLFLMVDCE